jgi:hypothetical protein
VQEAQCRDSSGAEVRDVEEKWSDRCAKDAVFPALQ